MRKVYDSEMLSLSEQKSVAEAIGARALIVTPSRVYALGRLVGFRTYGRKVRVVGGRALSWPALRLARHPLPGL